MKSTKLFTSIAALALVLGLGACNEPEEEVSSEGGEEPTSSETTTGTTTSTDDGVAYAIVGDFTDASWNNSPDVSSAYYIPAGTTEFKATVTIADEPDYGTNEETGEANDPWNAGLRVVEFGTWTLAVGSDDLDEDSTGVIGSDNEKNIKVEWGTTYDLVITLGETNSILVTEYEEIELQPASDPAGLIKNANLAGSYTLTLTVDEYESTETCSMSDLISGTYDTDAMVASLEYAGSSYDTIVSYTEDALLIEYDAYGMAFYEYLYLNCLAYDTDGNLVDAVAEFDYTLGIGWSYEGLYLYNWQYYFWSLFDAADYGLDESSAYILSQSGTDSEGNNVDLYTVGSVYTALYLVDVLGGGDFWYGASSTDYASMVWMGGIYFYPDLQVMDVFIDVGWFGTYDGSNYSLIRDDFSAEVSAVGETTIDEELIASCWALTEAE